MISCDLASDLKSYEQMVVHRKIKCKRRMAAADCAAL